MELSPGRSSFSDLVGKRVRDQGGRSLGRVFEVRAHWERDGSVVLDEVMIGRRSLWRRLRGPNSDTRGIPWENVVDTGDGHLVVRR
jgi:sporulation protein YlmC with PRC-barrel domain